MIKLVFTLRRREGITREEFHRYWHNEHAELVSRHADALRIRRYVQTQAAYHELDAALAAPRGSAPGHYDGLAELWWDSIDELLAVSDSEAGQLAMGALLEDEQRFIDLPSSHIWLGQESVVVARP
jgi:uncharacterized protein (TIGR02118 family)